MAVQLVYTNNVTVNETVDVNTPGASSGKSVIKHDLYNKQVVLDAGTSPPVTLTAVIEVALVANAKTIDLENLVGTNDGAISLTDLRVQCLKFRNKSTNANDMTLEIGASAGYDGFGATFSITLAPGGEVTIYTNDRGSDISGTKSDLDLSGTDEQVAELVIVAG